MKKVMNVTDAALRIAERALSLMLVFLMLAASVVTGGRLLGYDFGTSVKPDAAEVVGSLREVCEKWEVGPVQLRSRGEGVWAMLSTDGEEEGTLVTTQQQGKDIVGYAGATPLCVRFDKEGRVKGFLPLENDETPDFFEEATAVLAAYQGKKAEEIAALAVDGVSGATLSSEALKANVRLAAAILQQSSLAKTAPSPGIGWGKTVVALFVLALGAYAHIYKKGKKRWRWAVLWLNVCVLGFGTGQFLSLFLLQSWVANGVDVIVALPVVAMLLLTIVLSFFGHQHHHCTWVCPYGSLQDLAFRLPLPKVRVRPVVMQRMRRLRQWVLLLLLGTSWLGVGIAGVLEYEPFSAFLVTVAAPATLVLASMFLVASMFVPQVWCRAVCPLGEVLELATEARGKKAKKE